MYVLYILITRQDGWQTMVSMPAVDTPDNVEAFWLQFALVAQHVSKWAGPNTTYEFMAYSLANPGEPYVRKPD